MFCWICGEEIHLFEKIDNITFCICENCEHETSVRDNGKVSNESLVQARNRFQQQFEDNTNGIEPFNKTISRMLTEKAYKTKLYHPDRHRNVEAPGDIRART